MATRKTSRAPQQASLFDDLVTDTPAGSPSSTAAAPAAPASVPTSAPPAAPVAAPGDIQHLAAQFDALPDAWRAVLAPFVASDAYGPLCRFVDSERAAGKTVYPTDVFRALRLTSPDDVKVVILGQDPYHGDDRGTPQAHGLAFSVPPAVKPPPSLRNIFKEIAANFGHDTPRHGCLDSWARQGVLLLNTVLTVERGAAASHAKRGWEQCTDTLIHELANRHRGLVFMLWGAHAQAKRALFDANAHCVLEAPHPSPLSAHRGFLGCRHFALANDYLVAHGRDAIDWRLPDEAETFA
ncbi:uracil-DNA glycosylase [Burkholderia ubonensis]|uniref:Uracil-DNA glycosylase n=1 Tax=Burkholderia ubonensis TaxID=101571 RepID=A0AB74D5K8_9BURK|nr:uracil-DNA glycosylase [Burkholderia ubonensis]PAJ80924.1 uracil-DNA glycosylase [Burkholderia ubonensis]PAJ84356.1 uracil-DNA glycosylase [Burkholderia ubonensis]PAJ91369.1 uracil-DNA glycosylase [Burkholderia ubonensis]PAK01481.1 uracil-DNA glycosylase [Burkholderia ubonensis]PAK04468.1 uracil-DNA glycosylase [Burkholderia ubonensis]